MTEVPKRIPITGEPDLSPYADLFIDSSFEVSDRTVAANLLKFCENISDAAVLDVGTGAANIPIYLAQARKGWRITGIDVSPHMLDVARRNIERAGLMHAIALARCSTHQIPAPSGSFDVVLCNGVLHYVDDVDEFWRELVRVAKPGATVLVRDLKRRAAQAQEVTAASPSTGSYPALLANQFRTASLAAYSPEEVRQQLKRAGLERLTVTSDERTFEVFGQL
ncbi:class I SAM-dependent methyltransferase [Bradyrhizobium sp. SZCCHNRI1009]|uniref:class I SAM-dependent methyltransferase n=1 Tax=Bradyrhizobium sp. SZCCHNRI1009 TaxID=3057277 RepID=UPI0029168A64|nr:class I SAM-dependent methyltransferase [Bradyrhizobium sp. SZCCHNRI1009]